jgi:hypothetical protein
MAKSALPRPLDCGSYHPGHDVHWIQAKLSYERPAAAGVAQMEADGWVTVHLDAGDSRRVWTHDPVRLAALLARTEGRAELRAPGVLAVPSGNGYHCVSVASEPSPCPDPDEDVSGLPLDELVRQRGGFSIPGDQLLDFIGE